LTTTNLLDLPTPPAPRERGQNLFDANRQWAWRPDDQRFLTLEDLAASVRDRKENSREYPAYKVVDLKPEYVSEGPLAGNLFVAKWGDRPVTFSNWSFNQYNSLVGGPNVGWLREMPAPIAAYALQASMEYRGRMGSDSLAKLYLSPPAVGALNGDMRAITSTSYGRIFDAEVVTAVERVNRDGRWTVPLKAYQGKNSKLATTLYASDRDVWMFLVDETHPIEIDGETFFRGFITWNSEVGASTFGLKTFLYRYVCQNRIIWDAVQVRSLAIRHTNKAPDRFLTEAAPVLAAYSEMGTLDLQESIRTVKGVNVAKDIKGAEDWLRARGLTQEASRSVVNLAELDGGAEPDGNGRVRSTDPTNLWNLANGISAYARGVANQDERVALETKAGELMSTSGVGRRGRRA
jgi:hypothetical protein